MRKIAITLVAALAIASSAAAPAKAQFWGPMYGGWGYGGYGGYYGMMGAGLAIGALAGAAIAASNQPYYGGGYYAQPQVVQRKQIIIRNSPGARVIENDIFDW